jgi:hypothetical protein
MLNRLQLLEVETLAVICTAVKRRMIAIAAAATALLPAATLLHKVVQRERVRGAFLQEIPFLYQKFRYQKV